MKSNRPYRMEGGYINEGEFIINFIFCFILVLLKYYSSMAQRSETTLITRKTMIKKGLLSY